MTLVCLEEDKKTLSKRFRKTDYFAFLEEENVSIEKNPHKFSKSPEFFDYFKTLNIDTIYLKALGYKTFLTLEKLGVKVYLVEKSEHYKDITPSELQLIDAKNAEAFCTLGHK